MFRQNQVCAERVIQGVLNILCVTRVARRRFIFTLTKVNTNRFPVQLVYNTSQRFDFSVVRVATGREVWRWSVGRFFTPAIQRIRLDPGETTSQSVEWRAVNNRGNPVPPGAYRVLGENLARVRRLGTGGDEDDDIIVTPGATAMAKMPQLEVQFEHTDGAIGKASIGTTPAKPVSGSVHTVKSGDTLWKIASQYGVSVNKLKSLNNLTNPDNLKVGQKIKLK